MIKQGKDLLKSYRNRVNAIKDFNNRTGKAATAAEIQQHKQEACKAIFAIKSLDVWKECAATSLSGETRCVLWESERSA